MEVMDYSKCLQYTFVKYIICSIYENKLNILHKDVFIHGVY